MSTFLLIFAKNTDTMKPLLPKDLISVWTGEKKYINLNGKRFTSWQENGMLCFQWGKTEIDIKHSVFNVSDEDFLKELCRIVSLIFFWPEPQN